MNTVRSGQLRSAHNPSEKGHSVLSVWNISCPQTCILSPFSLWLLQRTVNHSSINSSCVLGLAISLITQTNYAKWAIRLISEFKEQRYCTRPSTTILFFWSSFPQLQRRQSWTPGKQSCSTGASTSGVVFLLLFLRFSKIGKTWSVSRPLKKIILSNICCAA